MLSEGWLRCAWPCAGSNILLVLIIMISSSSCINSSCLCLAQDCETRTNVRCHHIVCDIDELRAGAYVVVELRARLWNSTFLEVSHRGNHLSLMNLRNFFEIIK